ncbi:MAG: undecaprenyl-diphosphate phosphatase [Gammaproteobacteria bacterium]|nr:undecaprenyl-diphosphate phosphatase [Gammaproteobacteria bacterium]
MDPIAVLILALLQGLTEFLPISSSGHLILVPHFFGWQDQGLAFDIAVHVGTLSAVIWYFRRDLMTMANAVMKSAVERQHPKAWSQQARLGWLVLFATLPAVIVGALFNDWIEQGLRTPAVIAVTTIGFGILLWLADVKSQRLRNESSVTWRDALLIGLAQALALIPGTSRSGITMTAGLMVGLDRAGAARFSFLLSVPIIFIAGLWKLIGLMQSPMSVNWGVLISATVLSAVTAYLCIELFLRFLDRIGMMPFAIYRIALGLLIFVFIA